MLFAEIDVALHFNRSANGKIYTRRLAMQLRHTSRIFVVAIWFLMIGCASFEPALYEHDLSGNRLPTFRETQNGLEVSIEEFVSAQKSVQAFDADVAGRGVLALLVRVENKGSGNYRLARTQIRALLDGESLPLLDGKEAADQAAARDPRGRALGWLLATGPFALVAAPVALVASSAHTQSVNQQIEHHFVRLEFPDALVKQDKSVFGFIYFKLPFRTQKLDKLTVQIDPVDDATEQKLSYRFSLPTFDIELPYSLRERNRIDND